MRNIVCDASSIISLVDSCMFGIVKKLSNQTNTSFLIPEQVKVELVDRPIKIRRFELSALLIDKAIRENVFKVVGGNEINKKTQLLDPLINSMYSIGKKNVHIMHSGELGALGTLLAVRDDPELHSETLLVDERTTRLVLENPEELAKILSNKTGKKVVLNKKKAKQVREMFSHVSVIRSTEVLALAFSKGYLDSQLDHLPEVFKACLYKLKFNGCSITSGEINQYIGLLE